MRLQRIFFMVGIFILALFASRSISMLIFHPYSSVLPNYSISTQKIPSSLDVFPDEQLNFLLIQTNQAPNPEPIGIWWVAITSDSPVTLVSLYPNASWETESLINDFRITEDKFHNRQLSADFISKINEQEIPWDGYLVLEPAALAILVDSFEGLRINGVIMDGEMVSDSLTSLSPESLQGRSFQSDVWSSLCQKAILAGSKSIFDVAKNELSKHMILSPDFPVSFMDIQNLLSLSNIHQCEVNLLKSETGISLHTAQISDNIFRRSDGN